MLWAAIGLVIGITLGILSNYSIPIEFIKYTAVIIIAILDALFGAIKAEVENDNYNISIFLSGLLFNTALALFITFVGENLGLELYLAVSVVFILRIFQNLGKIRQNTLEVYLSRWNKKK